MNPALQFTPDDKSPAMVTLHWEEASGQKTRGLEIDREAFGRFRRELVWTVGEQNAHGILARTGYSCGSAEVLRNSVGHPFIRGFGNITKCTPVSKDGEYVFQLIDSTEAAEHVRFFGISRDAQCWLLAGYLTGLISRQSNQSIYFLETKCVARQDGVCEFVGRQRDQWSPEHDLALGKYLENNISLELHQIKDQLKQTKDRYQNLFEHSTVPTFIIDPDTGVYLDVNVAAELLTGYTREELLRMNVFDIRPPKDHQAVALSMREMQATDVVRREEIMIVRKDGAEKIVERSSKMMLYGEQHVIVSALRDITDLKLAEQKEKDLQQQLLRSERLSGIGRLAAGVAHEIKNPLGAIRNAIYYIRNALVNNSVLETDPQIKEIMQLAEEEVDGAVTIIEELLDFSRVVDLNPRRTQINELLEKLPHIVHIPDNVEIIWDLDITLPSATVDPDRLQQVVCNLVNNAVQAMPQGGRLKVTSRLEVEAAGETGESSELVTISIQDTGSGIQPHHLKKIFEPLFTTKARGTGLGLAITHNIVEKHGGSIVVASQVGKGTTFTVKLPLHTPNGSEENNHVSE